MKEQTSSAQWLPSVKTVETHFILGEINEWTHRGSEQNIWRGGDVSNSGNCWRFCITSDYATAQSHLEGWFTSQQLRAIACYMDRAPD